MAPQMSPPLPTRRVSCSPAAFWCSTASFCANTRAANDDQRTDLTDETRTPAPENRNTARMPSTDLLSAVFLDIPPSVNEAVHNRAALPSFPSLCLFLAAPAVLNHSSGLYGITGPLLAVITHPLLNDYVAAEPP